MGEPEVGRWGDEKSRIHTFKSQKSKFLNFEFREAVRPITPSLLVLLPLIYLKVMIYLLSKNLKAE
nr:hypothetical protein [Fischerella sp. PCC 9605]